MKLTALYSNDDRFRPVRFSSGLNVVLAQIRQPGDFEKDTHNLGKSTIARLIDFCLLRGTDSGFFLLKHIDRFEGFTFYLEVETNRHGFVTIARSPASPSKISVAKNETRGADLRGAEVGWEHRDIPIDRAKAILGGLLDLTAIKGWDFRDSVGYSLRDQNDYKDVFQLEKFRGSHADWKPFLAHILGLNGDLVERKYELETLLEEKKAEEQKLRSELAGTADAPDRIDGILLVKQAEADQLEADLANYSFGEVEKAINKELVDKLEAEIAGLNERRYSLSMSKKRIDQALAERLDFDVRKVTDIYEEAKVVMPEQLKRSYDELVAFNRALSKEREHYLKQEMAETVAELQETGDRLQELNASRVRALATLKDRETFSKYKALSSRLVAIKADIETLARQKEALRRLRHASRSVRDAKSEIDDVVERLREQIEGDKPRYNEIRRFFRGIIHDVLGQEATLYSNVNKNGNLEFAAEFVDERGQATSQSLGHTYRKLLCISFDLAVLRAYQGDEYVRFVFHDGIFESLDDRKKLNLIDVLREYSSYGIQHIVTTIESELPLVGAERFRFEDNEIACVLHDQGNAGRLFNMPSW